MIKSNKVELEQLKQQLELAASEIKVLTDEKKESSAEIQRLQSLLKEVIEYSKESEISSIKNEFFQMGKEYLSKDYIESSACLKYLNSVYLKI
jgi:hypothetical protein